MNHKPSKDTMNWEGINDGGYFCNVFLGGSFGL